MRLLLDTHALIWALAEPERLEPAAVAAIADPGSSVFVSAAAIWEIAIKRGLARPGAPPFDAATAIALANESGMRWLSVQPAHAAAAELLPQHHQDPFDRVMIAQARAEGLALVSRDRIFASYDVSLIAA